MKSRWPQFLLLISVSYGSWLGMLAVHELGHVINAWVSGGTVTRVVVPLWGISRTDVAPNPSPLFVVWGGAVWGVILPLVSLACVSLLRWRYGFLLRFFCGVCLVANGAYLGAAVWIPVGDAELMLRLGTPVWLLGLLGLSSIVAGFALWNGQGRYFGLGRDGSVIGAPLAIGVTLAVLVEMGVSWHWFPDR